MQQGIVKYALLTAGILLIGGYFGYQGVMEYQTASKALATEKVKLAELKNSADKVKQEYGDLKKDMDKANSGVNEVIDKILPSNEDFTNLARALDKYFLGTNSSQAPMFLSDLRFAAARAGTGDFSILPMAMNVNGNEVGLKNFLNFIEASGDLNDGSRLLDVATITLNYQNKQAASDEKEDSTPVPASLAAPREINASVNLNAYFQKPLESNNAKQ